jgi:hypothetical protein
MKTVRNETERKCRRGHPMVGPNLFIRRNDGRAICLACRRTSSQNQYYKKIGRPIPDLDALADWHYTRIVNPPPKGTTR